MSKSTIRALENKKRKKKALRKSVQEILESLDLEIADIDRRININKRKKEDNT